MGDQLLGTGTQIRELVTGIQIWVLSREGFIILTFIIPTFSIPMVSKYLHAVFKKYSQTV